MPSLEELQSHLDAILASVEAAGASAVKALVAAACAKVVEVAVHGELQATSATAATVARAAKDAAQFCEDNAAGFVIAGTSAAASLAAGAPSTLGGSAAGMAVGGGFGAILGAAGMTIGAPAGAAFGALTVGGPGLAVGAVAGAKFARDHFQTPAEQAATAFNTFVAGRVDWSLANEVQRRALPRLNPEAIDLDALFPRVVAPGWAALSKPDRDALFRVDEVEEASRAEYSLTAKTSRLTLSGRHLKRFRRAVRETTAFVESHQLDLAGLPIADVFPHPDVDGSIYRDRIVLHRDPGPLAKGRLLILTGVHADGPQAGQSGSELLTVERLESNAFGPAIVVSPAIAGTYVRTSVRIAANVVHATDGVTRHEVLGSGDSSAAFQTFVVREGPVTYVSAATDTGRKSTLDVRVNGTLWREVPALFGRGPHDRVFVTRRGNDGRTIVQFGDGVTGARVPTGAENITATYRVGIGQLGAVKARQLSLLMDRPLGITAVTNPLAATGSEDPEALADARRRAPGTVLAMARTVSLSDFANFARSFAGVGKAHATWVWFGGVRGILVTVAGSGGAALRADSRAYAALVDALGTFGDPGVPVKVISFDPAAARFRLAAGIVVHPDYLPGEVTRAVTAAIDAHFHFNARDFGQPVVLSEAVAAIHAVPGVIGVDVDALYRGDVPERRHRLPAATPRPGDTPDAAAAELLLLADGGFDLRVIGGHA